MIRPHLTIAFYVVLCYTGNIDLLVKPNIEFFLRILRILDLDIYMANSIIIQFKKLLNWLILFTLISSMCWANDNWKLVKQDTDENIMIYYSRMDNGMIKFKGVTQVKSSLNSFIALINDLDNIPNWVSSVRKIIILKRNSQMDGYIYTINKMPWPLKDRDSIVYSRIVQDPKTNIITISGQAEPKFIPPNNNYVRVQKIESFWQITPLANNYARIEFQGFADPGGNISSVVFQWLYKFFLWRLPYYTLKNMKQMIQRPKYQHQKFEYINEGGNVNSSS